MALVMFSPNNMTNDTTPSPFVTSGTGTFYGGFGPFRAFDGRFDNFGILQWEGLPGSVTLDIGAGNIRKCAQYKLTSNPSVGAPSRALKSWTFHGSNDNVNFTLLHTVSGAPAWSNGEERTYTPTITYLSFRYFKINVTENQGGDTYTIIVEAKYYYDSGLVTPAPFPFPRMR